METLLATVTSSLGPHSAASLSWHGTMWASGNIGPERTCCSVLWQGLSSGRMGACQAQNRSCQPVCIQFSHNPPHHNLDPQKLPLA